MKCCKSLLENIGDQPNTSNRIFLLTDMEVNQNDSHELPSFVSECAKDCLWTSVIGVGVDMTQGVVEQISKTPGANYSNVRLEKNFFYFFKKKKIYLFAIDHHNNIFFIENFFFCSLLIFFNFF